MYSCATQCCNLADHTRKLLMQYNTSINPSCARRSMHLQLYYLYPGARGPWRTYLLKYLYGINTVQYYTVLKYFCHQ